MLSTRNDYDLPNPEVCRANPAQDRDNLPELLEAQGGLGDLWVLELPGNTSQTCLVMTFPPYDQAHHHPWPFPDSKFTFQVLDREQRSGSGYLHSWQKGHGSLKGSIRAQPEIMVVASLFLL